MSIEIERLRAVGRAATEGPWFGSAGGLYVYGATPGDEVAQCRRGADAEFVRTARNEWNALLDEVEVLRGERDAWRSVAFEPERMRSRALAAEAKVARVEALAEGWERIAASDRDAESRTLRAVATDIRAALADESARDGLSRAGTTAVALGDAGDVGGAQIGSRGTDGSDNSGGTE